MLTWFGVAGLGVLLLLRLAYYGMPKLARFPAPQQTDWPLLSIVIAARNEAQTINQALQSLLASDYPNLELVLVNDRSTDGTGDILEACRDPRVRLVHIQALPSGWLGKNHALQRGAESARGELLLFTDADIVFAPETLRRAVEALRQLQVDHLVLTPTMLSYSFWEKVFISYFAAAFGIRFFPGWVWLPTRSPFVGWARSICCAPMPTGV